MGVEGVSFVNLGNDFVVLGKVREGYLYGVNDVCCLVGVVIGYWEWWFINLIYFLLIYWWGNLFV